MVRNRKTMFDRLPSFGSASVQCLDLIERAKDRSQLEAAINRFVLRQTSKTGQSKLVNQSAVGVLRSNGLYSIASEVESFLQSGQHSAFSGAGEESFPEVQSQARELVNKMEAAFKSMSKSQVRRSARRQNGTNSKAHVCRVNSAIGKAVLLLLAGLFALSTTGFAMANDHSAISELANSTVAAENAGGTNDTKISLSESQRQTILNEAGEFYSRAVAVVETDAAEANDLFTSASAKYQVLIDSGISNSRLYMNLGNAYLQSNQLGKAIVNFERAKSIDPTNRQLAVNLELANSLVKGQSENGTQSDHSVISTSIVEQLREANRVAVGIIGETPIIWALAISSLSFWGLLIVSALRTSASRYPWKRIAIVPLIVLIVTATSYGLSNWSSPQEFNGVIIANNVTLHSGDGKQFDEVATITTAQGHRVKYLDRRGDWAKIETATQQSGWVRSRDVAQTNLRSTI